MSQVRRAVAADLPRIAALARWVWLDTYATHGVTAAFAAYVDEAFHPDTLARRFRDHAMWVIDGPVDAAPHVRELIEPSPLSDELSPSSTVASPPDLPLQAWAELDSHTEPGRVELTRLYVARPCQGRRLGVALLAQARRAYPSRPLWLSAWEGNHGALRFYRREGAMPLGDTWFELDGRRHRNELLGWPPLEATT